MSMHQPSHPGEILRHDIMAPLNISVSAAAHALGISRKTLSNICNGHGGITPEVAVRLEMVFSKPSAAHWMKLQMAYNLHEVNNKRSEIATHVHALAL